MVTADQGVRIRIVVTASDGSATAVATSSEAGPVALSGPSVGQVRTLRSRSATPLGIGAKIGMLLKHGYSFSFHNPQPGGL